MSKRTLTHLLPLTAVAFVATLFLAQEPIAAFIAAERWSTNSTEYVTDGSLGAAPFPAATIGLVNTAAARWSQPSTGVNFTIVNFNGQIGPTRMYVGSANFANIGYPDVPGANALSVSGGTLRSSFLRLNDTWSWNTACNLNQGARRADVLTILLHEMGHSVRLLHDAAHPEAVMWPNFVCKQTLRADDVAGIDALY